MINEDETYEFISLGGGVRTINVGLDLAMAAARGKFIDGYMDVEEFEAEVDRLLHKGA